MKYNDALLKLSNLRSFIAVNLESICVSSKSKLIPTEDQIKTFIEILDECIEYFYEMWAMYEDDRKHDVISFWTCPHCNTIYAFHPTNDEVIINRNNCPACANYLKKDSKM